MEASNVSVWAAITGVAIVLGICGLYWPAFVLLVAVGLNDLLRIYVNKDASITSRVREAIPAGLKAPLIGLAWTGAFLIGGLPWLMVAVAGCVIGHLLWS